MVMADGSSFSSHEGSRIVRVSACSRRTWRRDSAHLKLDGAAMAPLSASLSYPASSNGAAHLVYSIGVRTDCCVEP
jgi:hypothetical protein